MDTVISIIVCCLLLTSVNGIQISTPQGDITGTIMKTANGREFLAFFGIPYAKPPVGELRFKNPVPYETWCGVRDGSKEPNRCIQAQSFLGSYTDEPIIGEEDCLYINVFTPQVAENKKYPVMVWIHGGGFVVGSSDAKVFGPLYLLDKDIILISFHYRLGFLGFPSSGDGVIDENLGLKDQNMALQWVKKNVACFSGDPSSITIFGESAGGASVHFQTVSPLSKGLFHRAIVMSGTSHCPWATSKREVAVKYTKDLAVLVKCPTDSTVEMTECLRKVSAHELTEQSGNLLVWDLDPIIIFRPVVEINGTADSFLPTHPVKVKTTVPLMIGVVKEEGALRTIQFSTGKKGLDQTLSELNDRFNEIGPLTMLYDSTAPNQNKVTDKIRTFYYGDKVINREILHDVIKMYSDSYFFQCSASALRNHDGVSYLYYLTQDSKNHEHTYFQRRNEDHGIAHGDELKYIFPMNFTQKHVEETSEDKQFRTKMINLWTNFAIHGNPTKGEDITWNETSNDKTDFLQLELGNFVMGNSLLQERLTFWQQLEFR